jgi:hypothetical protein
MLYIISPTTTSHPVFPHPHNALRYAVHYITHNHITSSLSPSARCPVICCTLYHPQLHHIQSFPIHTMPSDKLYIISPTTTSHPIFLHPHDGLRYAVHYITHNHNTCSLSPSARCPVICCTLYHPQPHHPLTLIFKFSPFIISTLISSRLVKL